MRRGGTDALLGEIDRLLASLPEADAADWHVPDARELRGAQREADRVLRAAVQDARASATAARRRLDAVLLHPVAGLVILLAVLFVMFQAVFAWASRRWT